MLPESPSAHHSGQAAAPRFATPAAQIEGSSFGFLRFKIRVSGFGRARLVLHTGRFVTSKVKFIIGVCVCKWNNAALQSLAASTLQLGVLGFRVYGLSFPA